MSDEIRDGEGAPKLGAQRWIFGLLPVLLLAWLPVIGDPLCLFAGLLRVEPLRFVILVGLGKLARYAFLAWAFA